jgi:hypothetical protein
MSKHENTVNRTIDGDSAEGHLKLQHGEAEIHQQKFDDEAEGHKQVKARHTALDDETEGHAKTKADETQVNRHI